jgi:glycosyltransferase involved in cell wall biosynthesis
MKLSIVMPVYNERATIEKQVKRVLDTPGDRELIIVDDASTDGTGEVLRRLTDTRIRVFFHDKNKGKGAALQTGFAEVHGDVVIIQDADLEYDPQEYPKLLAPILDGKADVVYGSRFMGAKRTESFSSGTPWATSS